MSLKRKENNLRKAQARLEKVSRRSKEFQINFQREQNKKGRFKTKIHVQRGEKNHHSGRGIIHKAVNLKYRINGDKPSFTRFVNSKNPKTFIGKTFKISTQAVNFISHDVGQTAVDTALAGEDIALKTAETAVNETKNKLKQKYTSEAVDDYHKGIFFIGRTGIDAVKGTRQHFKLKKQHKFEKAKFKFKKAEFALYKNYRYKPKLSQNKALRKNLKKDFKLQKEEVKIQKKISRYSKTDFLILKPVKYSAGRMTASAWQKAVSEDSENDFMRVADSAKRRIIEPTARKISRPQKLQKSRDRHDKNTDKKLKNQQKLHHRENKLNRQREDLRRRKNKKISFSDRIKKFFTSTKNICATEVKAFFGVIAVPIIIIFLIFAFIIMIFSSVVSGGGFTLGTYAAQDYDLSEAEKYYTQLAWNFNENLIMVGDSDKWRKGLKRLGADTKKMKDNPDNRYFGKSDVYSWTPDYDFDCYKLWAFLCAYYYDFGSKNGDIKYWKFTEKTAGLLNEIFNAEYEFVYWYDNQSRWEELSTYNYWGGGGCDSGGTYYSCEPSAYIYDDEPFRYRFKPTSYAGNLGDYADSEGYICINSDYRVLNPNDDYAETGLFIMDNRYFSGEKEPFYYCDGSAYFLVHDGECYDRSFWGWDSEDSWFMISPNDAHIWNGDLNDTGLYGCYEKYYWKTECNLYYSVKQKNTFDEVIENKLKSISHSDERLQYYRLLVGEDSGKMYGNHQTLQNILKKSVTECSIENGFGYDMQEWNEKHCEIDDLHEGIDIKCSSGEKLYAPFDCKISEIDTDENTIVLHKDDVKYWYDGAGGTKRDTEVYITNVTVIDGLKEGDKIKSGQYFADSTGYRHCDDLENTGVNYVHLKVKIDTDGIGWDFIDPRLVLY